MMGFPEWLSVLGLAVVKSRAAWRKYLKSGIKTYIVTPTLRCLLNYSRTRDFQPSIIILILSMSLLHG